MMTVRMQVEYDSNDDDDENLGALCDDRYFDKMDQMLSEFNVFHKNGSKGPLKYDFHVLIVL